ncbi:MAG: ABC transporter ATP-binding protein/permease, partial [Granulosicoccus sp.]|nr:ABC transporter ATP-binding protein/permease [Granulosicoccus sp.]
MSVCSAIIAIVEVRLVGYLGHIVDVLSESDRTTPVSELLPHYGWMLLVILGIYPILVIIQTMLVHQTLLGNLPMIMRWQAHRYLLGHSLRFFSNEFAGRIGTKVMQTSLAVRETVMKLLDILVYVGVYFLSILWLVASADWRMMLPLLCWLAFYIGVLRYFVPRLQRVAQAQADARSLMTGRIIDSYTNIGTVKLFSHAGNEAKYARDGMES